MADGWKHSRQFNLWRLKAYGHTAEIRKRTNPQCPGYTWELNTPERPIAMGRELKLKEAKRIAEGFIHLRVNLQLLES